MHGYSEFKRELYADICRRLRLTKDLENFVLKGLLKNLLKLIKNDFKLAHKITENHIIVPQAKKRNVRFAAQFLTNIVAKAILYCGEHFKIEYTNWKEACIYYLVMRRDSQDLLDNIFSFLQEMNGGMELYCIIMWQKRGFHKI